MKPTGVFSSEPLSVVGDGVLSWGNDFLSEDFRAGFANAAAAGGFSLFAAASLAARVCWLATVSAGRLLATFGLDEQFPILLCIR